MLRFTAYLNGGLHSNDGASIAVGNTVYCFGNGRIGEKYVSEDQIGVFVFNTVSLRWKKLPLLTTGRGERLPEVPPRCFGHTAVLIEGISYIWGGTDDIKTKSYDEVYAFDVDTHRWFKPTVSGTAPDGRVFHSACVFGKVMYIYGGYISHIRFPCDWYKLDTSTMVWSSIHFGETWVPDGEWLSVRPPATAIGKKMFVFVNRHIRVFDTETNCWLYTPSAQLTGKHWFYYSFACDGELCIFAGQNSNYYLLKFNLETFSWKKVELKGKGPGSSITSMLCCMVGDHIIIFGGFKNKHGFEGGRPTDDLYVLDLNPSLKTLCKLAVIQYGLEQSGLTHDIRWELAAMTTNILPPRLL